MLSDISQHALDIGVNSIKAGAKNISVSICCKTNQASLQVKDNGCGFDEQTLRNVKNALDKPISGSSHNGLKSLYKSCEGHLDITSSKGKGTAVSAIFSKEFPLGDIKETIKCLFTLCEGQNIRLIFSAENNGISFLFDSEKTGEIIKIKGIQSVYVYKFLDEYITDMINRVFLNKTGGI